jgi:hypothetical protein
MVAKKLPKKKVTKKVTKKKIIAKSGKKPIKRQNPDSIDEKWIKYTAKRHAKLIIEDVKDGADIYRIDLRIFINRALTEAGIRLYDEKESNKAKKIYISELKKKLPKEFFRVLQTSIEE